MRALFYLPAITERYFENVVLHLVKRLSGIAEIHIAGPPQWEDTGLTEQILMSCIDMPEIQWHVLDGDDHETLRTVPADPEALIDYVRGIDPDYTFCRSADTTTPMLFPGKTRFIMEPAIPPIALREGPGNSVILDGPRIFDQGMMPALDDEHAARIDRLFSPRWDLLEARFALAEHAKEAYFRQVGLPLDRKVVMAPLNHQATNNFFLHQHSPIPSNAALIEMLAEQLDDDVVLALTLHPLNLHADILSDWKVETIERVVARYGDRVRIVTTAGPMGSATTTLAQYCDGIVIGESKAFGLAAFFGKPILRISRHACAPWMNAYSDIKAFIADVGAGTARRPENSDARAFLGFHYANNVFATNDPALTGHDIIGRFESPVDPSRWEAGISQLAA